jgi:hypothetical protein
MESLIPQPLIQVYPRISPLKWGQFEGGFPYKNGMSNLVSARIFP